MLLAIPGVGEPVSSHFTALLTLHDFEYAEQLVTIWAWLIRVSPDAQVILPDTPHLEYLAYAQEALRQLEAQCT